MRIVVGFSHEEAGVLLLPLFKVSMIKVLSIGESQKLLAVFLIRPLLIFNGKLVGRIETVPIGQTRDLQLLKLQPHHLILLLELLNLVYLTCHLLELGIFLFEMQELLMNVTCAAASLKVEDFFQMLHLLLQFLDVGIICGRHLVGLDFHHDLLGTISELEG